MCRPLVAALLLAALFSSSARSHDGDAGAECDRAAASPSDKSKPEGIIGVDMARIDAAAAIRACEAAVKAAPDNGRLVYQLGRAFHAAKDYQQARQQYEKADRLGHAPASSNIGFLYSNGQGVVQDYAEARRWYEKGAEKEQPNALANLSVVYELGRLG